MHDQSFLFLNDLQKNLDQVSTHSYIFLYRKPHSHIHIIYTHIIHPNFLQVMDSQMNCKLLGKILEDMISLSCIESDDYLLRSNLEAWKIIMHSKKHTPSLIN